MKFIVTQVSNGKRVQINDASPEQITALETKGTIKDVELFDDTAASTPAVLGKSPAVHNHVHVAIKDKVAKKAALKDKLKAIDPSNVKDSTLLLHDAGGRTYDARKAIRQEAGRMGLATRLESGLIAVGVVAVVKIGELLLSDKAA